MEQKEFIDTKNSGHVSSEGKKTEKETPETKDSKNATSENKNMNKGTLDVGLSEVASNASGSRINSPSNVVKDRGKIQHEEESAAYGNIPLTKNTREFRETAKYRDAESYVNQHHHSIGEGLYMTDEILDLPPRFRTKVIQALENALVANNIKIDRNPLEYFTSYSDASKELDKNKDKLVYIPPDILEDARKSSEIKSDSALPLKSNLEKKNSDSNFYPSESRKPPPFSTTLDSQVPSQNFRSKSGIKPKPPFSRTYNDYGTWQKNAMGKYIHQPNVQKSQNQMLDNHQENASVKTSSLPPKPFNDHSKFTPNIPDSHVDTKTSVGNFQHNNKYTAEGRQIIDFYQKTCNPIQPPSDVEMSFDCRYETASDTNEENVKKDCKKKFNANKSTPYTNHNDYGKRISVDDLFKQSKALSNSELNKISDDNVTIPCSNSKINPNSKLYDKKRTFPNSKHENKKSFKSQAQYSAINSTSLNGNKSQGSSSESSKYSVKRIDSSVRNNTFAAESTKGVKSEGTQFKPDTISYNTTDKYNTREKNCEPSHVQQISKSPSYSGKDISSKSKGIPSKHFASDRDKKYENNSYSKNNPNKEKLSRNSGKIFNVPPEKVESNMLQDLSLKNNSVQNRHRTRNYSPSSISSSYSSKSCEKVPRYSDACSSMQDSSTNNVYNVNSSNHNSFESFSHQGPMYKKHFDKGNDLNKRSKNYRYSDRDKYSDSSSVLSDKSGRTSNFSNNSISDETYSQRSNKGFAKSYGKHFDGKRANNFFQNSKLSSRDQEISRRKRDSHFPPENHHHRFNKTDDTTRKSNFTEEKENNSKVLSEKGFFVKVEISENVTDLEQWINYFRSVFQFPFELERCCHFSNVLILEFERKEHAYAGLDILYKEKRILQRLKKPHFLLISSLLNRLTKPCNCNKKVISDCIESIEKHFESSLRILISKIEEVEQCNSTAKKYNSKRKFNSVESKILESFEESISNFTNFKEETIHNVETAENLREVQEFKHLFIRECNTFKRCLPIYSKKFDILNLARFHSVSVIIAETGSGKSTQLVEYLLHSSIAKNGLIICTQPRKLAAISIAQFVSGQIGSAVGKIVGYDVGIEKKFNDTETKIIYMTDYCLLKYFLRNRDLKKVSCIIIDEAHERSLYTDLILGLLKEHLKSSKKLSVLITSATINPSIFIDYFSMSEQCVIEVPGRTYPVDVVWLPEDVEIGWDYLDACVHQAYDIHVSQKDGDILVFLTSPGDSEEAIYLFKRLLSRKDKNVELLSLHGKTDIQEQMQIFQKISKSSRKIIFATNVAETAVTIPGIKYVVDSGMTKELMFDPQKNKSYLTVTFTTKSAAEQRKGRAGRTQSGICYRMYSKRNYAENMPDNAVPEILKSNLQRALLKIFELGIDPENFDFIEAPPARTISNSVESLEYLGAVANKKLTDFGKKLVKLPLEPQLSKLVLQGIEAKIGIEAIIIAALVSESGKLFIRNEENRGVADEKKRKFCHKGGDLCTFLEIYKKWKVVDIAKRYDWCVENFISFKALYAAAKTVKEILITLRTELGLRVSSRYNDNDYKKQYEKIIFDSFSENLCVLSGHPKLGYLSPYLSESFFIHPSSTLSYLGKDSPEFLVYGTLMETSRNFLFDITPISEATLKSAYQAGKFRLPLHTLRCLQVPPKIMGPFGESVLIRHILGKGGSKIRDLEKTLLQLTFVKNLYVDVDVVKGLITIYLSHRLHEKVESHIQQIINTALAEMLKEEDLVKLSGTSMYYALGAGGIINDIIMPGEFRELVFNCMQSKDSNELETLLQTYGPLQSFSHVKCKQEMQICATFRKVCDAKSAFLDLKTKRKYDVSPKLHLSDVGNKSLPLHMLLISWCCRPSTGFGLVELFSEEDLIEASGILTCNSFYVGNNLIMFQVAEEKHTLSMKNLPEFVEESTIKEKLNEAIPHIKVKSIQIFRKNVKITDATVENTKKKVSKLLSLYVSNSKFTIDLKYPKKDASWNAAVYFDSAVDAENTYMKLKDSTCIDSYPLSVRLIFKCQLYCKKNVFDIVSVQVNNILREKKAEGICNESSIKVLDGKTFNVQIEFSCMSLENLNKTRHYLRQFLEGKYLDFLGNSKYHFLFTEGLAEQINKIQKSTKTKLKLDKMKKAISIYGPPDNCRKAEKEIYQLALNQDYSFTRTFNLKDSCIPNGFLRDLYSKYGYDLHGLAVDFKLTVASIDNYGCTLTLKGSKEQIRKAEQALEKMCEELFQSRGKRKKANNGEENCPICLDPVSFDFQRLEHCGHAFCRQCLLLQLESKTMPVVCVKQECGKLIFLEDIKRIISFGGDTLKKTFCAVALQHHVSSNIGKLSYCQTPDCQMIYRITTEGSEYNCPSCKNSTCTRCQSPYHYGMSCEMFQECQKNVDYSLKEWVKENESVRKHCPSCNVVIEKSEGCNHMECLKCKTHFCWLCLEIFPTGDKVYDHMPYCPKNQ